MPRKRQDGILPVLLQRTAANIIGNSSSVSRQNVTKHDNMELTGRGKNSSISTQKFDIRTIIKNEIEGVLMSSFMHTRRQLVAGAVGLGAVCIGLGRARA